MFTSSLIFDYQYSSWIIGFRCSFYLYSSIFDFYLIEPGLGFSVKFDYELFFLDIRFLIVLFQRFILHHRNTFDVSLLVFHLKIPPAVQYKPRSVMFRFSRFLFIGVQNAPTIDIHLEIGCWTKFYISNGRHLDFRCKLFAASQARKM